MEPRSVGRRPTATPTEAASHAEPCLGDSGSRCMRLGRQAAHHQSGAVLPQLPCRGSAKSPAQKKAKTALPACTATHPPTCQRRLRLPHRLHRLLVLLRSLGVACTAQQEAAVLEFRAPATGAIHFASSAQRRLRAGRHARFRQDGRQAAGPGGRKKGRASGGRRARDSRSLTALFGAQLVRLGPRRLQLLACRLTLRVELVHRLLACLLWRAQRAAEHARQHDPRLWSLLRAHAGGAQTGSAGRLGSLG